MAKNKTRMTVGPFVNWMARNLPKCVHGENRDYSKMGMSSKQRDHVLRLYGFATYKAYLRSDLWASIRERAMRELKCCCGCGSRPTQVHHRCYSEANLLGHDLHGLVGLNGSCHYDIEFNGERKTSLGQANESLRKKQFDNAAGEAPPTAEEVRTFLAGKHRKMPLERKLAVKRHLKLAAKQ